MTPMANLLRLQNKQKKNQRKKELDYHKTFYIIQNNIDIISFNSKLKEIKNGVFEENKKHRIFIAAFCGEIRLIDNQELF